MSSRECLKIICIIPVPADESRYTRSTNAERGKKSMVLETINEISYEYSKSIKASEEGTYEVVSIRDRYCGQKKSGQPVLNFK